MWGYGSLELKDFRQSTWDELIIDDCRQLIRLAVREDLGRSHDLTTMALVPPDARGAAAVVTRQPGVVAGGPVVELLIEEMNLQAQWKAYVSDGAEVQAGTAIGIIEGVTRDLLTSERILLNFMGRLSGIATFTHRFVSEVAHTRARIYDTRKTTPGWRRLEKYAVKCGGGRNHRLGLFDAVLIKDNHLAQGANDAIRPSVAVAQAREFLAQYFPDGGYQDILIEVEVDTLDQFDDALTAKPDIILLDNMPPSDLRECVRRRDAIKSTTELEASGGITLQNVRAVAESGIERISLGALTHSAIALDVGLDWSPGTRGN